MESTYHLGLVAALGLALGVCGLLSGCKGNAQPQDASPPEVSVIELRPAPVTVYDEYVAQTQAPDTIEIRSQVTGLLRASGLYRRRASQEGRRAVRH